MRVKRRISFLLILSIVLCLLLPTAAHAEITNRKVVRVGWFDSPYNYSDKNGRRSGYSYEYQQKVAAYTGWQYEYIDGSWPELLEKLKTGEIDLLSDVSYTEERSKQMQFSSLPMGTESYYLFTVADNAQIRPGDFYSVDDMKLKEVLLNILSNAVKFTEAAAIRAMDREDAKRIPIITLTANAFDEDVQRSLQAGMNAHLNKPVDTDHLIRILGELIYEAEN